MCILSEIVACMNMFSSIFCHLLLVVKSCNLEKHLYNIYSARTCSCMNSFFWQIYLLKYCNSVLCSYRQYGFKTFFKWCVQFKQIFIPYSFHHLFFAAVSFWTFQQKKVQIWSEPSFRLSLHTGFTLTFTELSNRTYQT